MVKTFIKTQVFWDKAPEREIFVGVPDPSRPRGSELPWEGQGIGDRPPYPLFKNQRSLNTLPLSGTPHFASNTSIHNNGRAWQVASQRIKAFAKPVAETVKKGHSTDRQWEAQAKPDPLPYEGKQTDVGESGQEGGTAIKLCVSLVRRETHKHIHHTPTSK